MARTRSIRIRESLEELEQLRRFYKGTPQERRTLFLSFLKESSGRTIAEASSLAGISERRGRRWWDAYRKGGLSQLFDLRIWKKEEMDDAPFNPNFSGTTSPKAPSSNANATGIDFPAFLVALAGLVGIPESTRWARAFGDLLAEFIPEINYVVVTLRLTVDITDPSRNKKGFVFRQQLLPGGDVKYGAHTPNERKYNYEAVIEQGQAQGFPFEKYHFPPAGFDFYLSQGQRSSPDAKDTRDSYIGCLLLFRNINEPPFSDLTLNLIERLRPFIVYVFSDILARTRHDKPGADLFQEAVDRVAGDVGLTPREQNVLLLEMLGHSYDEIAELLHVSPKTIQTHVRQLYQKAGVSRLSEFFARYFTPRTLFPEKKTE